MLPPEAKLLAYNDSHVAQGRKSRDVPRELAITRSFAGTLVTPQIGMLNLQVAAPCLDETARRNRS